MDDTDSTAADREAIATPDERAWLEEREDVMLYRCALPVYVR